MESMILDVDALVGQKLTTEAFSQLSGEMAGFSFVKIVVDNKTKSVHFLNDHRYKLHAKYIATKLLSISEQQLVENIDTYNKTFYYGPERPYFLGILSLINKDKNPLYALETVEVDDMKAPMLLEFYNIIKENLGGKVPLYFKPSNHGQEEEIEKIDRNILPRMFTHEIMLNRSYIPLNNGETIGRLRYFDSFDDYQESKITLKWHDIIAMKKVPEDIPRISGIINAAHTAPLSHTNVLACGWQIPNSIQIGIEEDINALRLNNKWVSYKVERNSPRILLEEVPKPENIENERPRWMAQRVKLQAPETERIPILNLNQLRMSDSIRYGTKAANLGELYHILENGSHRLTGFYNIERYPRPHLLEYLANQLKVPVGTDLKKASFSFLKENIKIPRGIALPFSIMQQFLQQSPQIQQTIGKLKMALELEAKEVDSLCIQLQQIIRKTKFNEKLWEYIDSQIAEHLSGSASFVVRSSSNAEDLEHFSAAGIYESYNHVTNAETVFNSIKEVWASLVSPRSVRLRQEVGISLDDCYMGVVIQEEVTTDLGGVLVTTNPMNPNGDYRNVYINASPKSATEIVSGAETSFQCLYNIVEGGGRTLAKDSTSNDLTVSQKETLRKLAVTGKLLQSHFSPDYTYRLPVDIEWALQGEKIYLLQIRPYSIE